MSNTSRREYKVMLDHQMFLDRKSAVESFCRELHACARRIPDVECDRGFEKAKKREIVFLDTFDETIRLNDFVFRQRRDIENNKTEYTLKCRSPDHFVAAGADVSPAAELDGEAKLEEDIGAPFVVRYSHSCTVKGAKKPPRTLGAVGKLFPALGKLDRDGAACADDLELRPVNAMEAFERVVAGPLLRFARTEAEVALILWSDGANGRPLVAEFSFRYAVSEEGVSAKTARRAMTFFEELQRLDWCLPAGRTKTQYAYQIQ